jgi:hypothetical protein
MSPVSKRYFNKATDLKREIKNSNELVDERELKD